MNTSFFLKRRFQVLGFIFILTSIIFLNIGTVFHPIRSLVFSISSPLFLSITDFCSQIQKPFSVLFSLSDIRKTNEDLFWENKTLKSQLAELEYVMSENDELKRQLDFKEQSTRDLFSTRIIGYGDPGSEDWLVVDKGESSGAQKGMAVLANASILIGRIEEVYEHSSRVQLLTSRESVVNVRVAKTRTEGVVRGRYGLGLQLDMVLSTETLSEGDNIVTSEISSKFPAGLFVGVIQDIRMSEDGLSQIATIDQGIHFHKMEIVWIDKTL